MKAKVKEMVTVEQLANMIDHTNLKAFADDAAFEKLCDEAKKYNFKMVAINPVKICREAGKTSKVIFENCYLTDDEKRKVAEIAKEVKPDFIKTSTGFGTGGATVEDVKLMKSVVGDEVKVKAAGGIRDLKTALAMIEAGAERLGTSAGVAIVEEYNNQK